APRCDPSGIWEPPSATPHAEPTPLCQVVAKISKIVERRAGKQARGNCHVPSAPERNRTSTPGSGGLYDIHFTTGAAVPSTGGRSLSQGPAGRPPGRVHERLAVAAAGLTGRPRRPASRAAPGAGGRSRLPSRFRSARVTHHRIASRGRRLPPRWVA